MSFNNMKTAVLLNKCTCWATVLLNMCNMPNFALQASTLLVERQQGITANPHPRTMT